MHLFRREQTHACAHTITDPLVCGRTYVLNPHRTNSSRKKSPSFWQQEMTPFTNKYEQKSYTILKYNSKQLTTTGIIMVVPYLLVVILVSFFVYIFSLILVSFILIYK